MTAAAVRVAGLRYAYPDGRQVLRGVGFDVEPGERVAILGPNGAGKTTLVLHLNGINLPHEGEVRIGDTVVTRDTVREVRRRVGVVFQDPDDQLFMPTVGEDVAFGPANYGVKGQELAARVERALARVGLADRADAAPQKLSLGQRRRAAIATILSMEVDVVVLDEPTSNLDPASRHELSRTLAAIPSTLVVVTHDLPYALETCHRAFVLDAGEIVASGPTRELLADTELMAAHGLELPWGFDPARAPAVAQW